MGRFLSFLLSQCGNGVQQTALAKTDLTKKKKEKIKNRASCVSVAWSRGCARERRKQQINPPKNIYSKKEGGDRGGSVCVWGGV